MTTATIINNELIIPTYVQDIINTAEDKRSSFNKIILEKFLQGLTNQTND